MAKSCSNSMEDFLDKIISNTGIYIEPISYPTYYIPTMNFESMLLQEAIVSGSERIKVPKIKNVIFNNPATIVYWEDGTKTVVKCQTHTGDTYSKETGLAMCFVKKVLGNNGNFNEVLKEWCK